jgi:hypothetical protein
MTAASSKPAFKALARELAAESIVTKALGRFLEQIFEDVHAQEIQPLLNRIRDLEAALEKSAHPNPEVTATEGQGK